MRVSIRVSEVAGSEVPDELIPVPAGASQAKAYERMEVPGALYLLFLAPVGLRLPASRHLIKAQSQFGGIGIIAKGSSRSRSCSEICRRLVHMRESVSGAERSRHCSYCDLSEKNAGFHGTIATLANFACRRSHHESDGIR
jgi:hypothetical protein